MGVYGYDTQGIELPEGYIIFNIKGSEGAFSKDILYPSEPGSIYHLTKTIDADMFQFYNKNDGLRITDLHQGIVWGTDTFETSMHQDLINRFDYDGEFGTVLNRFCLQSAVDHPITVYGEGGQTRAFINLTDSINCISLAIKNPPKNKDKVHIYNQVTETHSVIDLAERVAKITNNKINKYENPRNESSHNTLKVKNEKLLRLGLSPVLLSEDFIIKIYEHAIKYKGNCDIKNIISISNWNKL